MREGGGQNSTNAMKLNFSIVLYAILFVLQVNGANILYIAGVASRSHFIWNRPLIYALAAKGHNVTALTLDVEKNAPKNVHFIQMEGVYNGIFNDSNSAQSDLFEMGKKSPFTMLIEFEKFCVASCHFGLLSKGFVSLMAYPDSFAFDLVINDFLIGPCFAAAALHKFNRPPMVAVTAFNGMTLATPMLGSFAYSGIVPNHEFDATEEMCFTERIKNVFYNAWEQTLKQWYTFPTMDKLVRQVIPDIPYVTEFDKLVRIVLPNANAAVQYTEPAMPGIVPVGGLHIHEQKPLPTDLHNVMDNAKQGAILFSLGSNVRSDMLGKERISAILKAMKAFPQYVFLWKFESDTFPVDIPKNVLIRSWLPQNDLLAHKNMLLFITHSGLLSTQEAIWFGVPMIGFPVFADQYRNINYCTKLGVAKRLSVDKIDSEKLREAIEEMVTDSSYRENMRKLSHVFRDQPEKPLDRAVWWIEWVLRHPDATYHLSHAADMGWFKKYSLDVALFIFVTASISLHIIIGVIYRLNVKHKAADFKKKSN